MIRIKYHLIIILGILTLNACLGGDQEVHEYVDEVKRTSVGKINELPPEKPYIIQEYTAQTFPSPFDLSNVKRTGMISNSTNVSTEVKATPRPDADRRREYLEQFHLKDLIMVGTLSNQNNTWGLVKDTSGMVYAVKVGDYLGPNSGRVTEIKNGEIKLLETVSNGEGGWKTQENAIIMDAN